MKNIHLFDTKNSYDAAKSGLILPRVSYIKENKDIKNNPTFEANGHDYVEIAGIKWATMNVGAKSITDYGLYFQWGDIQGYNADQVTGNTEPKKAFSWSDYSLTTNGGQSFTKYNETGMTLELVDDAVRANWGGSWRMPTTGDMQTVYGAIQASAITANWTSGYNGTSVAGYELHDKTSNDTLFFPACGFAYDGAVYNAGVGGSYWLSSLYSDDVSNAYGLYFNSDEAVVYYYGRCGGYCVRGVLAEN